MSRAITGLLAVGGLACCCAAAVQISQLTGGQAGLELINYAVTSLTALAGLSLTLLGWRRRRTSKPPVPPDDRSILAALDLLFGHFSDDAAVQEAVRMVARAVTERRYHAVMRVES